MPEQKLAGSRSARRRPLLAALWSAVGWLALPAGGVGLFFLIDRVLPPLHSVDSLLPVLLRGVPRAALSGGITAALMALIYQASRAISARGRQMRAAGAPAAMARDPRPPVLYLRSFQDDKFSYFALGSSLEENLAAAFRDAGPMVAIGWPDESLPPLGAARWYVGHHQWQEDVTRMLDRASVVIIRPGVTAGVQWEVDAARQRVPPERLLIVNPPGDRPKGGATRREALYAEFRAIVAHRFPKPLPETIGNANFIAFDEDWTPRVLGGGSVQGRAYRPRAGMRAALKPFAERLGLPMRDRWWDESPLLVGVVIALLVGLNIDRVDRGAVWTPFEHSGAKFTVDLPAPAEQAQQRIPSATGEMVINTARTSWSGVTYTVEYFDLPANVVHSWTHDKILDRARNAALESIKGELLRETPITLGANAGRELVVKMRSEHAGGTLRCFLIGAQLVTLAAYRSGDEEAGVENAKGVQTFFDSLKAR